MNKIKGLIFDLDGVLVNTKKIHFVALNKALKSVKAFLDTKFEGGRHLRRVKKI